MTALAETGHSPVVEISPELNTPDALLTPDRWGIRPIETVVRVRGIPIESLSPSFLHLLHSVVVEDVDGSYIDKESGREDGQPVIEEMYDTETSQLFKERYVTMLTDLGSDSRTVFVGPLYGVYDIIVELQKRGIPAENIIPGVFGTGTSGTQTATQEGFQPLVDHHAWGDPKVRKVGLEDVIDSETSQASIVGYDLEQQGDEVGAAAVRALIAVIKKHRNYGDPENFLPYTHPILQKAYSDIRPYAAKTSFVEAAMFIKNRSVVHALDKDIQILSEESDSERISLGVDQAKARVVMTEVDEQKWIVGLGMDTKIVGSQPVDSEKPDILRYIEDPRVREYLIQNGITFVSLRTLSKLPFLGWFRGDEAQLAAYTAKKIEQRVLRDIYADEVSLLQEFSLPAKMNVMYSFGGSTPQI